jgi:hypothetical protein
VTAATAAAAIRRLMAGPGRSVRTSLLVPNGAVITVLPLTMFPRAIDSVLLRTAAFDPALYGPIGQRQGNRAKAWGLWLAEIPGVKVAERLKIRGPAGRTAGDLDLLALDPDTGRGIVLELKWPIDALTLPETTKTVGSVMGACRQLGKNRRMLRTREATIRMPDGWPSFGDVEWTWAVGTPQQLHTGPLPEPGMFVTSLRYLKSLGKLGGIDALIAALRTPNLPRLGEHYTVEKATMQLGRYEIYWDTIHALDVMWRPSRA